MQKFSRAVASLIGHPMTFVANILLIVVWAGAGPLFSYSNTWQLVVNTGTTVITYLMLFVLQNSQNKDGEAIQAKLDTLIQAIPKADDKLIGMEKGPAPKRTGPSKRTGAKPTS